MSKEQEDKAIAVRWIECFWGHGRDAKIIDELAADNMILQFSSQPLRRGPAEAKAFFARFHEMFPDLEFHQTGDLALDGEYVYGHLRGRGTHTGPAFLDYLVGFFPAHSGQKINLAGTIALRIKNGKIAEATTRVSWVVPPRLLQAAT
jgi:hypothetical protein